VKKKSGARRRTEDLTRARALAERHGFELVPVGQTTPELSSEAKRVIGAIGPPPADPSECLTWGRRLLSQLAWLALGGEIDARQARIVKDIVFALGATHNRGELEATVRRLQQALHVRQDYSDLVKIVPGSSLAKSPNARGARPRGPRAIPPDAIDDDPPPPTEPAS
jgi:hypothetical protein